MSQKNYLDAIVARKRTEVANLLQHLSSDTKQVYHDILTQQKTAGNSFAIALKQKTLAVIGEIKRKSPSRGELALIKHPTELATQYCIGGVSAISVLTDYEGFGGTLDDLQQVSKTLAKNYPHIPTLRKDFIIHPIQLAEAAHAGASCVLLIARVLGNQLSTFIEAAAKAGLETLTEAHDADDVKRSLDAGATIIGINHRNLSSFSIDITLSETLRPMIPDHVITVAESGIHTAADAHMMKRLGYDAILVGEALVSSSHPEQLIDEMRGVAYEN